MPKVAIIGANGFVGTRLTETLQLEADIPPRAIVRTYGGLAGLSRFELDWKKADATSAPELATALAGCDAVVSCVNGDAATIERSAEAVYQGAEQAGVRRLIYLSSFVVHGQAPAPGTTEESPLLGNSRFWYNNAKVTAEQRLQELAQSGKVELVILRPGIVWGPRSPRWTLMLAQELQRGEAALVRNGAGICNTIYVDNLVHAIRCAIDASGGNREAFYVGDQETTTWLEFYQSMVKILGVEDDAIHHIARPAFPAQKVSLRKRFDLLLNQPSFQRAVRIFPRKLKHPLRAAIATYLAGGRPLKEPSPWIEPPKKTPTLSEELCLLQECEWKIPHTKANRLLGYAPLVERAEAWARTAGWLSFAGYPQ